MPSPLPPPPPTHTHTHHTHHTPSLTHAWMAGSPRLYSFFHIPSTAHTACSTTRHGGCAGRAGRRRRQMGGRQRGHAARARALQRLRALPAAAAQIQPCILRRVNVCVSGAGQGSPGRHPAAPGPPCAGPAGETPGPRRRAPCHRRRRRRCWRVRLLPASRLLRVEAARGEGVGGTSVNASAGPSRLRPEPPERSLAGHPCQRPAAAHLWPMWTRSAPRPLRGWVRCASGLCGPTRGSPGTGQTRIQLRCTRRASRTSVWQPAPSVSSRAPTRGRGVGELSNQQISMPVASTRLRRCDWLLKVRSEANESIRRKRSDSLASIDGPPY